MQTKFLRFLLLLLFPLLFNCKTNADTNIIDFSILSPSSNWNYSDRREVLLSTNLDSKTIIWSSSIDGELGTGNNLYVHLSTGEHIIYADYKGSKKYVKVEVLEEIINQNEILKKRVTKLPFNNTYQTGNYLQYVVATNSQINNFSINNNQHNINLRSRYKTNHKEYKKESLRDIRLGFNKKSQIVVNQKYRLRSLQQTEEEEKQFYVANTENQTSEPHRIKAIKYYSSDGLEVWINKDDYLLLEETTTQKLNELLEKTEKIIFPKVRTIWGACADINDDKKIALIFCSTINKENKAIGFFNPNDFFKKNENQNEESYNPYSNEMDILYVAIPSNDASYNSSSILATIGHEYTHAINLTHKTYNRLSNNEENVLQEETFLDEGLSHLSENLCGYGVSGGNIDFFRKYLENPGLYSFCKNDYLNRSDSVGQRGAMTLFLSWIFWKQGGITWDSSNNIIDNGGISFLRNIVNADSVGWETIGQAVGTSTERLFLQMVEEIQNVHALNKTYEPKLDPVTNEPLDFFVNMKLFNKETLGFFPFIETFEDITILPWSIIPIGKMFVTEKRELCFNGKITESSFFLFDYYSIL